jgi:predicted Holliday junction resolvase-like endonuclease
VVFVEIKTGPSAALTSRSGAREAVDGRRVGFSKFESTPDRM